MTEFKRLCPICHAGTVNWCDCNNCYNIVCDDCGAVFDLAGSDNPETIEELREICKRKYEGPTIQ